MIVKRINKLVILLLCVSFIISFSAMEVLSQQKTLIIGSGMEPADLLPSSNSQGTMDRTYNIYQPLVFLSPDAKTVPCLATKWEAINGNKKWRFHLRKGVIFHNGEKFTAEDVIFTLDFTKNPENKLGRRAKIKGYAWKMIDDYTVDVFREDGKLVDPLMPPVWLPIQMLPKDTVSKMALGELARRPIGTGPFRFVEWRDGEQVTLEAFDGYWGGRPKIDKVIFKTIPEIATRIVAVKTGDVDLISDVPPEEIESLEADPNVKVIKKPSLYNMMLTLRCDEGPFKDDINLRKAVAYAIDIDAISNDLLGGYATPLPSVVPSAAFGYNKNLKPYKYDPKLAKEYLKKSGYKGEVITIQSSTGRYLKDIEINTAIEAWLKAIGIKTKLNFYDWPTWMNLEHTRKTDHIRLLGWTARSGDGAENLFNTSHSDSPYSWYGEKGVSGVDEAIDTAGTSFDPKIRKEAIEKAQKLLHDYVAFGFNYGPIKVYALRKNVKWTPRADEAMVIPPETDK